VFIASKAERRRAAIQSMMSCADAHGQICAWAH